MSEPPVVPRALSPESGSALPLEDLVRDALRGQRRGVVGVIGGAGFGKSTALRHLERRITGITFLDEPERIEALDRVVVYAARKALAASHLAVLKLGPWGRDECIEYLLARYRAMCASVMQRIDDFDVVCGIPELWCAVLEELAADETLPDVRAAIRRCAHRFTHHWPVRVLMDADIIAAALSEGRSLDVLNKRRVQPLVEELARLLDEPLALRLRRAPARAQPMAMSILHAAGESIEPGRAPNLRGAYLTGVRWPAADLRRSTLQEADLSEAGLENARLDKCTAGMACFDDADLRGASMERIVAGGARFRRADLAGIVARHAFLTACQLQAADLRDAVLATSDLREAKLRGARLDRCDLTGVDLRGAEIPGADFTDADLSGARLSRLDLRRARFGGAVFEAAHLAGCNLDGMELPSANFQAANLADASFTHAQMPGALLRGACLRGVRAGDVNWEGADLSGSDMRRMTFYMGSSRSGLVDSPIASEGSRTGFYTDDYEERHFKTPEEIRKANLRGADLRGAQIEDTDFYLVDLRDARYDRMQLEWFRRCRAILETPVL